MLPSTKSSSSPNQALPLSDLLIDQESVDQQVVWVKERLA
jgi:hypothetical protein